MKSKVLFISVLTALLLIGCGSKTSESMKMLETNQLIPWYIVPFDGNDHSPLERNLNGIANPRS